MSMNRILAVFVVAVAAVVASGCSSLPPLESYYKSRQEVISASQECESAGLQPRVVYSRVAGINYPVPVEVVCDIKYYTRTAK